METQVIRYNLKDRGRKHVGQARNFNIKAICDAINSPACQERVATRGMAGYYGHMPRVRFGMNPVEGVIDGGKYVPVEPAFVTTYLKADYDGNVEHKAEFLDTAAGILAAKLFNSKMGGFSTAIDQIKPEFYGMDYVLEPNFINNSFRGLALDSIADMTYDDVYAAEQNEHIVSMNALLDSVNAERNTAIDLIDRLTAENEQLVSMLATSGISQSQALDSASIMPIAVSLDGINRIKRDTDFFRNASLPAFIDRGTEEKATNTPTYSRLLEKFTR